MLKAEEWPVQKICGKQDHATVAHVPFIGGARQNGTTVAEMSGAKASMEKLSTVCQLCISSSIYKFISPSEKGQSVHFCIKTKWNKGKHLEDLLNNCNNYDMHTVGGCLNSRRPADHKTCSPTCTVQGSVCAELNTCKCRSTLEPVVHNNILTECRKSYTLKGRDVEIITIHNYANTDGKFRFKQCSQTDTQF